MGAEKNAYMVLVGKTRKKTTRKTCRRWEDNIKMFFREIGCGDTDRVHMAEALQNKVRNLLVP
jgi:hypothetical protein